MVSLSISEWTSEALVGSSGSFCFCLISPGDTWGWDGSEKQTTVFSDNKYMPHVSWIKEIIYPNRRAASAQPGTDALLTDDDIWYSSLDFGQCSPKHFQACLGGSWYMHVNTYSKRDLTAVKQNRRQPHELQKHWFCL